MTSDELPRRDRSRLVLLLSPLPALLVGLWVMRAAGVASSLLALQAGAACVALGLAFGLSRWSAEAVRARARWGAVVGLVLAAMTLLFPGMEGVHRWLSLGPVKLHASSLASPAVLVGAAAWLRSGHTGIAVGGLLALQALHVLHPDAGQATAFGAGALVLVAATRWGRRWGFGVSAAGGLAVGIALSWARPDPLGVVPHVEHIVQLVVEQSALLGIAAVLVLVLPPLALARGAARSTREQGVLAALAAYAVGIVLVPLLGNFPVPVMGFGVSPVLGTWLVMGVVAALGDRSVVPSP